MAPGPLLPGVQPAASSPSRVSSQDKEGSPRIAQPTKTQQLCKNETLQESSQTFENVKCHFLLSNRKHFAIFPCSHFLSPEGCQEFSNRVLHPVLGFLAPPSESHHRHILLGDGTSFASCIFPVSDTSITVLAAE
uniref:Uncharacterized protein n=1 Tax=Micrurus lemniscatus lemniscatus TaxID=129467 RepID=A0A2D4H6I7_MICLE